jgi:hypothetical protein
VTLNFHRSFRKGKSLSLKPKAVEFPLLEEGIRVTPATNYKQLPSEYGGLVRTVSDELGRGPGRHRVTKNEAGTSAKPTTVASMINWVKRVNWVTDARAFDVTTLYTG